MSFVGMFSLETFMRCEDTCHCELNGGSVHLLNF